MKTAIITGINGQLGQYMAKYLLENEPEIRVVGTVRHKSFDNQPLIFDRSKITFELMDLSDPHSIEAIVSRYKPDYFINTAANAFVGESWLVPAQHLELNSLAVLHQLEAIRKHSPRTRYFNMGTSEEFGVSTKTGPQDETTPLDPKSPYGCSKCAARHIVSVWRQSYNLFAIQGWTFNFESPIRGEKYVTRKITLGVARIARAIKDGKPFESLRMGNVNSSRSWQYAGDVAAGIWLMLNQSVPKEYVLSANGTSTVKIFIEKAFAAAGIMGYWAGEGLSERYMTTIRSDTSTSELPLVTIDSAFYRPSDVTYLNGDSTRAREELGWTPKVSFDELVTRMVRHDLKAQGIEI